MPAIVGAINVNNNSGVFNIGDVGTIAPSSFNTTFAGGGSFNSGDTLNINNSPSIINIYGNDVYEQNFIDGTDQEDIQP
ncbi:spore germination protein [Paenibacillus spongiae]|uniref:Spore germination protein n=1 Tax=Paenibacillus spongiae TaxID=2909671 RepID=A0ABY5SL41_9BACL|nr:spore germination protein [Paenibacillus spongiae]UVI33288.1 spore germination protein [Paenibacillus spongiae]